MEEMKRIITVIICAILILSSVFVLLDIEEEVEGKVVIQDGVNYLPHVPIRINGNGDFAAIATSGDGSPGTPWIIEGWEIDGGGAPGVGYCLYIGNTTDYFVVRNCYFYNAYWINTPYYVGDGIILYQVQNGKVENNILSNNEDGGIYIRSSSNNTLLNTTCSFNNFAGINFRYSNNITIVNNTCQGNWFGITSSYSNDIVIINSTISSDNTDLVIDFDSHLTTLNTTFDPLKTSVDDGLSTLTVQWFLNIYVNNINNEPVLYANVTVYDSIGTKVYNGTTDTSGYRKWIGATEYIENSTVKVYHTPHNITVSKSGYYNGYSEPNMNESKTVIITLTPDPKYNISLQEGWNLISLSLEQSDESLDQALSSIAGKWDYIRIYDPLDPEPWKSNCTYKPNQLNDFDTLNHTQGFWINITELNVNLTVRGYEPSSTTIPLYNGWNLVGYPTLNSTKTIADAFAGTNADIWMIGNTSEPYQIQEVGAAYVMKPGKGYWVHVTLDDVWIVNW